MLIKFNNIRDLADARYAAALMAEWIGFTVGKNDSLPAGKIQEIIGWCAGPKLVLEAAPGVGSDILDSLMTVLPVDGIEANESDYLRLKNELKNERIFWIINGEKTTEDALLHSGILQQGENIICKTDPVKTSFQEVAETDPWAISVDCQESTDQTMKDFDMWNTFFEGLEMI